MNRAPVPPAQRGRCRQSLPARPGVLARRGVLVRRRLRFLQRVSASWDRWRRRRGARVGAQCHPICDTVGSEARGDGSRGGGGEQGGERVPGRRRAAWARRTGAAGLVVLALAGCDNMKHQDNLRAERPTPQFANGTSAQLPPPNTVAHGAPAPDDPVATGLRHGALVTTLPVPLTRELLERGRERFEAYCSPCHGSDGYGRGIVVRRGFPSPPSYHDDRLRNAPIGHFYDVITHGYGAMYPYAERVTPSDRWAIAAYIRALQRSQHATLADVPADERSQLAAK